MTTQEKKSTIELVKGDITHERTDAIVNAANSSLMGGGGVDGAIHLAGGQSILLECMEIVKTKGKLPPGKAVITGGGNLLVPHVIHTVGPIWRGGNAGESEVLKSAYINSLTLAINNNINSIAFPSISTGAYGYPKAKAATVAIETVSTFLKEHNKPLLIRFVLFSEKDLKIYQQKIDL
jgi:O-acetyl-ADP-ribose deacetylase (regulator of RNase III)